jgi:hypothetical protein
MEDEAQTFNISFEGEMPTRIAGDVFVMDVLIRQAEDKPFVPVASFGATTQTFDRDERKAEAWRERTWKIFEDNLRTTISEALGLLLYDAAHLALIEEKLADYDKRGALHRHLTWAEKLVRKRLKMEAGRPASWTAPELSEALRIVMETLPETQRTYAGVAKKIGEIYPGRAPKSGESLRKTVVLLGIDWKKIKRETAKRS